MNGTINNVVTSLTVANGTVFPASGNFRIIVDSELMLCTARSGNVLTVTRGIETTTAAGHTTGALVTHVATKAGLAQFIAENSVAQTIIDAKGDILAGTAADTIARKAVGANGSVLMADSTQADGLLWGGAWTTYAVTWATIGGTAPAIGNGTLIGRYAQVGKTVFFYVALTAGSTTTFGTLVYSFSLPVSALQAVGTIGSSYFLDASASAVYAGFPSMLSTTTFQVLTLASPVGQYSNLVPVTLATSDQLLVRGTYEAA